MFLQSFAMPETVNFCFSGAYHNTRAGVLSRLQWPGLETKLNTHFFYINTWWAEKQIGLGLNILSHHEYASGYRYIRPTVNYAHPIRLSRELFFRYAIDVGIVSKFFGSNIVFGDQINIEKGTTNPSSIDPLAKKAAINRWHFAMGTSVLFSTENSWIGLSLKNVNQSNTSIRNNKMLPLDFWISLHGSVRLDLKNIFPFRINPNFENSIYFMFNTIKQGKFNRLEAGMRYVYHIFGFAVTMGSIPLERHENQNLLVDLNFTTSLKWDKSKISFSYGSDLRNNINTQGVFELSYIYNFKKKKRLASCPKNF